VMEFFHSSHVTAENITAGKTGEGVISIRGDRSRDIMLKDPGLLRGVKVGDDVNKNEVRDTTKQ